MATVRKHLPVAQGNAKAWVLMAMDASATASFNVTSTDDDGTADFGVNFAASFASANYACSTGVMVTVNQGRIAVLSGSTARAAGAAQVRVTRTTTGSLDETDVDDISLVFFGAST